MKTILAISACILTFAVFAGTRQLGEIRANDYVVTNEDDRAAIAYTTAVSNKLEIGKQKKLVSGTNIKTVNGETLLGSGNIAVGSITDVRTNGVSAVSGGIANITIPQGGGGGGGADTNAVNDLIREYDTTNLTARINYRTTTNDVNAIIASSNLCTVAAAQAMTNDATIVRGMSTETAGGKRWNIYVSSSDEAEVAWDLKDEYWGQYGGHPATISGYGITDAYTKEEINGTSVTNGGAKAYADYVGATTLASATNSAKAYADATKASKATTLSGYGITDAYTKSQSDSKFLGTWETAVWADGASCISEAQSSLSFNPAKIDFETDGRPYVEKRASIGRGAISHLDPDGTPFATSNMVERVIASKPAPSPLTGKTYDFANGSNFTKRVYTALTNVIQTLGGTVANPPTFD